MNNPIILSTYTYPHEAHLVQGYLESEGIETFIQDELTAQINNFYSNAIGGVKIMIAESDYNKGIKCLIKGGFIKENPIEEEIIEFPKTTSDKLKFCPFCKSENIGINKQPNLLTIVVYFILGAFFPIFKSTNQCFDCSKKWRYKK